ncbi:MAG: glutamate-5-semialdehyde dehydrogenase [Myxococcaceae bacterium]|nr:glutamate-5-semialdehyde dehydrogenase [Myxococcaceae bacterium]MCA3012137.1 glutamate-5-semialdehyde dehydrogenase [Myxococcaceae bacterium]
MRALAARAKAAARVMATAPTPQKDRALRETAAALRRSTDAILSANALDVAEATAAGKNAAFLDRLLLDAVRVEAMAKAVEAVVALEDPVGEVTSNWRRPNGLEVRKVRLPLGVVLMIYEARPNVTSDVAALCLKSGNVAVLRGGSEAFRSNGVIAAAVAAGLEAAGLPSDAALLVPDTSREAMLALVSLDGLVDLCIPRGGEGLIRFVAEHARVPVVKHYQGVCHVYVHGDADLAMAERIVVNAKASRPGVCNAMECLLVDAAVAARALPALGRALVERKVELRGCPEAARLLAGAGLPVTPAADSDFGHEFLDLVAAVRVVAGLEGALDHIARYGSQHTEAIVTASRDAARRFTREVSASAVVVNASTRFNDGGELGLGAEVGISTSRLHAFGPMGLRELTSQKYVVEGDGQVR